MIPIVELNQASEGMDVQQKEQAMNKLEGLMAPLNVNKAACSSLFKVRWREEN